MTYHSCAKRARTFLLRRLLALGAVLLVTLPASAMAPQPRHEVESNRAFIDGAFARWTAGGSGFFDEVLDEQTVWTIKGSGPSAAVHRGRKAFLEHAVRPFAARMRAPVRPVSRQVWADGEHVIARWDGEGVAGDGRPYSNSYVWIFKLQGGRVCEVTAFLDLPAYDDVLRRVPAAEVRK